MVTRGQRRLGRTIRKLENSVELSAKESRAKEAEKRYLEETRKLAGYADGSPVQSLSDPLIHKKESKEA